MGQRGSLETHFQQLEAWTPREERIVSWSFFPRCWRSYKSYRSYTVVCRFETLPLFGDCFILLYICGYIAMIFGGREDFKTGFRSRLTAHHQIEGDLACRILRDMEFQQAYWEKNLWIAAYMMVGALHKWTLAVDMVSQTLAMGESKNIWSKLGMSHCLLWLHKGLIAHFIMLPSFHDSHVIICDCSSMFSLICVRITGLQPGFTHICPIMCPILINIVQSLCRRILANFIIFHPCWFLETVTQNCSFLARYRGRGGIPAPQRSGWVVGTAGHGRILHPWCDLGEAGIGSLGPMMAVPWRILTVLLYMVTWIPSMYPQWYPLVMTNVTMERSTIFQWEIPMKNGDFPMSYVKLPEGMLWLLAVRLWRSIFIYLLMCDESSISSIFSVVPFGSRTW